MRRPSLATIASYGTALGVNAAEGVTQLLIPPFLEQRDYPIALIGFLFALPYGVALVCRVPAGLVYRGSRARILVVARRCSPRSWRCCTFTRRDRSPSECCGLRRASPWPATRCTRR